MKEIGESSCGLFHSLITKKSPKGFSVTANIQTGYCWTLNNINCKIQVTWCTANNSKNKEYLLHDYIVFVQQKSGRIKFCSTGMLHNTWDGNETRLPALHLLSLVTFQSNSKFSWIYTWWYGTGKLTLCNQSSSK